MSSGFICMVKHCKASRPEYGLMCKPHWFLVPQSLRVLIWKSYRSPKKHLQSHRAEWARAHRGLVQEAIDTVTEKLTAQEAA